MGVVYMAVHELTHGVFVKLFSGVKPVYFARFPFLCTGNTAFFNKTSFVTVAGCIFSRFPNTFPRKPVEEQAGCIIPRWGSKSRQNRLHQRPNLLPKRRKVLDFKDFSLYQTLGLMVAEKKGFQPQAQR